MVGPTGNEPAILVVGAGPTGLILASQLARAGASYRLIERTSTPSGNSRAVAIHARTLELFQNMGIVAEFEALGVQIHGFSAWSGQERLVHVSHAELDSPFKHSIDLPQDDTERILHDYLTSLGGQVERGVELVGFSQDDERVTAQLRHTDGPDEMLSVRWVAGCDGAHSVVRHTLGVEFAGEALPICFAVGDLKVDWQLADDEWQMFLHPAGLFACFPIGGGRQRIIAEVALVAPDGPLPEPTLEDFQRWMAERGPSGARVSDPRWMTPFGVQERLSSAYRVGRAFLAGDAAHVHSPAGGQGMNTGIQDAYNLAWKLALVSQGHAPESILDSYEVERRPVARRVVQFTTLAGRMAGLRGDLVRNLRNRLIHLMMSHDVVQQRAMTWLAELPISYRDSPIVAEHQGSRLSSHHFRRGPQPGDRAPDVEPLGLADGTSSTLFELLRGTAHTLLLCSGPHAAPDDARTLTALADDVTASHGDRIRAIAVAVEGAVSVAPAGSTTVRDGEQAFCHRYGVDSAALYLIRPDGYVGYRAQPPDATDLRTYLAGILR